MAAGLARCGAGVRFETFDTFFYWPVPQTTPRWVIPRDNFDTCDIPACAILRVKPYLFSRTAHTSEYGVGPNKTLLNLMV